MKDITRKWYEHARADLEAAEILVKAGKSTQAYRLAVLHCHQAIEKILKTAIINKEKEPERIHDIIKLYSDTRLNFLPRFRNYIA